MPRYELEEDGVTKFWEVERDGTTFTAKWGKVGGSVSQRVYTYDDEDEADKGYDKHVAERVKKGYALIKKKQTAATGSKATASKPTASTPASNPELEAAIAADPDDDDAYLVYADWLQGQGDPRGELIAIQHQLAQKSKKSKKPDADLAKQEKVLLEKHAAHFYGPFAAESDRKKKDHERGGPFSVEWKNGFFREARLSTSQHANLAIDTMWPQFVSLASSRFLRELTIGVGKDDGQNHYHEFMKAVGKHGGPATVETLFIGDFTYEDSELSWSDLGPLKSIWATFPRLRHVKLRGGAMDLGAIDLPEATRFTIVTGGLSKKSLKAVAAAKWPKLESLELYFGRDDYGCDCTVKDLAPLLDGAGFGKLTHLGLMNSEMADELCLALPKAPILKRLTSLDLTLGTMSDAGGEALIAGAKAFAKLESLDLSENYLSEEMQKKVKAAIACAEVDSQREADDDGDGEVYRYTSIGE